MEDKPLETKSDRKRRLLAEEEEGLSLNVEAKSDEDARIKRDLFARYGICITYELPLKNGGTRISIYGKKEQIDDMLTQEKDIIASPCPVFCSLK